ncbi:putative ccmE/CycJ protein [Helianthus debilis subsp. tardiflorus]
MDYYSIVSTWVIGLSQHIGVVTPIEALTKYSKNPSKNKFHLRGLVLQRSIAHPASSIEMDFVIIDLITNILVRFCEADYGEIRSEVTKRVLTGKARSIICYFLVNEGLAQHDGEYMPAEEVNAIEKYKRSFLKELMI